MFHHRTTLSSALYVAVTLTILSLSLLWLAQPVAHAQEQPEALGSISGTVRNEQGDPLPNIEITLDHYINLHSTRTTTTDAQGEYRFLSLSPGNYRLKFFDATYTYAETYYGGSAVASEAELVTVIGNAVSDVDVNLLVGGTLAIELQATMSLTDTFVGAVLFRRSEAGQWASYRSANLVPEINIPLFPGLPNDNYGLCLYMSNNNGYYGLFQECYDNVLPQSQGEMPDDVTTIVITTGTQTTVSVTLGDISQLSGTVQTPQGTPLSGINVTLLRPNEGYPPVPATSAYPSHQASLTPTEVDGGGYPYSTLTDDQGVFRFDYLSTGKYLVQFTDPAGNYLTSYYNQIYDYQQAEQIEIDRRSRLSLAFEMMPTARITGTVLMADGGPAPYAYFGLYRYVPEDPESAMWSSYSDCERPGCLQSEYNPTTGAYTITDLIAGTYHLGISTVIGNHWHSLSEFYGGTNESNATDIVLTSGQTQPNINFVLGEDAFEGKISGTVKANSTVQAGIEVGLFEIPHPPLTLPLVYTQTNAQGQYHFEGLAAGFYRVGFRDPEGLYATTYAGNEHFLKNSPPLIIFTSTTISNVNVSLILGATIRGRVYSTDRKPAVGYRVIVIDEDYGPVDYPNISTDAEGRYTIPGLPPGSYRIAVYPTYYVDPYIPTWYYPGASTQEFAQKLEVGSGDLLEDIDIWYDASPGVLLPLIGSDKTPVE